MNEMNFGVPQLRSSKKEKYENEGVLTFLPTGEGLGRKVVLNSKAIEMLGITETSNQISFSFSGEDVYVVNTSGCDNCAGLKIGKVAKSFSDKKHYEHVKYKVFNSTPEKELELFLQSTTNSFNGNTVFKVVANVVNIDVVGEQVINEDKPQNDCNNEGCDRENCNNECEGTRNEEMNDYYSTMPSESQAIHDIAMNVIMNGEQEQMLNNDEF